MTDVYDIAVVGSGFAGSIFAMIARRLGRSVVLIERGRHPRVVIGESSTPLSNLLLEELAERYDLAALRPLTKWGSWQRTYPELACGLKRGFTFFHHDLSDPKQGILETEQFLVAASPHDGIADTHWYRADLDFFLVREAQKTGVEYVDEVTLEAATDAGEEMVLTGRRGGEDVTFRARFVLDATGPRGFLHKALGLTETSLPGYPETRALYGHFSGVKRIGVPIEERMPYPVEDAAVHHVFDGGWIWMLRFNNGVTSAGVAATAECADRLGLAEGEPAWRRLVAKIPLLAEQFADATKERPFTFAPRLSFRSSAVVGRRWAMLPSAAGFVDPLLSTGFPLTLLGVSRLAEVVERHWKTERFPVELAGYGVSTDEELLATARLVAALYANMGNFEVFRAASLLYFAAASFSEAARRLGRPSLARSFLLHDDPVFGRECREMLARLTRGGAAEDVGAVVSEVQRVIERIDVAGLSRLSRLSKNPRRSCYPVCAEDLMGAAWKLGATRQDVSRMLDRAGFYVT